MSSQHLPVQDPIYAVSEKAQALRPAAASKRAWLQALLPAAALALGALQAIVNRQAIDPDGLSYLDLGDVFARGEWKSAVNGYWSPLYPALQGIASRILHPSSRWQFPVAHLVNFLIFVAVLACFVFFWCEVVRNSARKVKDFGSESAWLLLGYAFFVWCSVLMVSVSNVMPDLFLCGAVFVAAGLLLRIHNGDDTWRNYTLLGFVLGTAYLIKAVMFPLGFVFLACSLTGLRRSIAKAVVATVIFIAVCSPWILALSQAKGRPTFGDAGLMNTAWQGWGWADFSQLKLSPGSRLLHPPQKLWNDPPVYGYSGPIQTSYPFWYDASYWLDGLKPAFHLRKQLAVLEMNVADWLVHSKQQYWAMFALLLLLINRRRRWVLRSTLANWYLLIPGAAAILLYCLVFVANRYVAVFMVLMWTAVFAGLTRPRFPSFSKLWLPITLSLAIAMTAAAVIHTGIEARKTRSQAEWAMPHPYIEVADELRHMGIRSGDQVGSIGDTFQAYWARFAGVTVIAEIPHVSADRFWLAAPQTQQQVLQVFARSGAKVIVADKIPLPSAPAGWHQVRGTSFFLYPLFPLFPPQPSAQLITSHGNSPRS